MMKQNLSKLNLATTVSVTSTYAGQFPGQYISALLLEANTLANNLVTIKPNIAYKMVVKKGVLGDVIQATGCDFNPTSSVTLTERILEPVKLKVDLSLCSDDFKSDWEAEQMGASANSNELPPLFKDWLLEIVRKKVGAGIEPMIWNGSGAAATFSGFTTLFKADSDVLDVSGTSISASNVMAELAKLVTTGSTLNLVNPVIYCAKNVITAYLIALGGFGAQGLGAAGFKSEGPTGVQNAPLFFAGVELLYTAGLNASEMVYAEKENLWFGTSLLSDYQEVNIVDQQPIDTSHNYKISMRFTGAVQYGIGSEIAYYWIF